LAGNVRAVVADRAFLAFALATAPTTLLADHTTVVPLKGFDSGSATLFFCVLAATAASVQPWVAARRRGERPWTLRCGLLLAGAAYLTLALLDGARSPIGWLLLAGVLAGAGNGLLQASVFQRVARLAAPERFGSYFGVMAFVSGMFAAAGGMAVGRLFDLGGTGAASALLGLAALGAATALLCGGGRRPSHADGAAR
jgi:MFS family permease